MIKYLRTKWRAFKVRRYLRSLHPDSVHTVAEYQAMIEEATGVSVSLDRSSDA